MHQDVLRSKTVQDKIHRITILYFSNYVAGSDFGCQGNVRLVMEEDGTQIDSDETLRACAGRVMLLLGDNEVWQPEVGLYDNHVNRQVLF